MASAVSAKSVKRTSTNTTRKAPSVKGVPNGVPHQNGIPSMPNNLPNLSAYQIMASRIANRVAEMAENYTFVERPKESPKSQSEGAALAEKRKPRKLEIRLDNENGEPISFSAPFLDNTLGKMLDLQQRMLKTGADLAHHEDVDEKIKREQFAQSAELSKIIALICAEKARQGA